ncbi:TYRO protein tyrosine kinase-binding protein-like [Heterodontus francisci]|uniref:TYRO protein tyrosine kinase-binding protein-like n=1 Tax=Heterodontus francisci TaxID=7792 RepID=UPI00355B8E52
MDKTGLPTIPTFSLLLSCLLLGAANGQNGCGDCYRIDAGIIAGIVIGDVLITIVIAVTIYYFASRAAKERKSGDGFALPMDKKPETESPYEELRGPERGVYSELRPGQK